MGSPVGIGAAVAVAEEIPERPVAAVALADPVRDAGDIVSSGVFQDVITMNDLF